MRAPRPRIRRPGADPLQAAGRAFRHRNFRLFFAGQSISLLGTWMQQVAMSWLVYRLTNSPFVLGVVSFAGQFPALFLAPIAGVLADRWSRRRIVITTQAIGMVQALLLALLTLSGVVEVWHVVLLATLLGLTSGFDIPARQSFLVELVDGREDLPNAIALNSSMFNATRLVGPALAGLLIAALGEGLVFLLNGLSYIAVLAGLLAIRVPRRDVAPTAAPLLANLREGFEYALGFAPIRALLGLLAVLSLVGMPYVVLMPVFATDVLGGGPSTLGFLMGATGLGALVGALYLAVRPNVRGLGKLIVLATLLFGVGLVAFSRSGALWLSLLLLLVTGFGMMTQSASSNTILQTIVDDDKRGRVMSLYTMAFMGMAPIGSLLAGALASRIGAPNTVLLGGIACIGAGLFFAARLPRLRRLIRPIYARLGIIPEVATGLQTATEYRPKG